MKSPIIYYGGKTSMIPFILPLIPQHDVYTETFFGGGAIFWAKTKCPNETINDTLDLVVNFYTVLKQNYKPLKKMISATLFSKSLHAKALFIAKHPEIFDKVERAWAFWFCSNFSYGNKIGGGIKYSNHQRLLPPRVMINLKNQFTDMLVKRIEETHIECRDAVEVLKSRNVRQAFHFIDPPYPNADQGHYRGYTFSHFEKLLQQCENLKGKFMLCNYNSEMLDAYVEKNNWWKKEIQIDRPSMRRNNLLKTEVLVGNYQCNVTLQLNLV